MNKIDNKNLYYLSLITLFLNPLNFKTDEKGIEIDLDYYKLIITGNIISSFDNFYLLSNKIKKIIDEKFLNKIRVVVKLYDKYGEIGITIFEKFIPNDKLYIFEDKNKEKILDFILDSDNKLKNIINSNIQYECAQLRLTNNVKQLINNLFYDVLNNCKKNQSTRKIIVK